MGIILPTGVANNLGTPGAITDLIANLPDAADIATGTIFVAPDVPAIYTNDNGTWKALSGGGGAAVNPTSHFIPYNLSGVFEDSFLYNDVDSPGILKTVYSGNDAGLYCQFKDSFYSLSDLGLGITIDAEGSGLSKDNIIAIGSDGLFPGGTSLEVRNGLNQKLVTKFYGTEQGLLIDYAAGSYKLFGSSNGISILESIFNIVSIYVATAGKISTESDLGQAGLLFDYGLNIYKFGDYAGFNLNGTSLIIDDAARIINTANLSGNIGISLDFSTGLYWLGDYNGIGIGNTYLSIDDDAGKIQFFSNAAKYNFANMPSYADNAAALAAGLVVGDLYRHDGLLESQDQLRIVH